MCVLGCECMDNKGVLVCVCVCLCQLVSERLTVGERERKKERVR